MGYARPRAHSPTDVNTDSDKIATTAIKEMFFMFILGYVMDLYCGRCFYPSFRLLRSVGVGGYCGTCDPSFIPSSISEIS